MEVIKKTLPEGWRIESLGEICQFLDSRRIPLNEAERNKRIIGKDKSELYPYYGANGQVGWIDDYLFDEPLILLAEDGGFFGSYSRSLTYSISGKTWVNNHAHVLRPNKDVDLDFLTYALSIRPDVGDMVTGNTRPKLNQQIARGIPVSLPPLPEQKRIAAILTERLAAVEQARKASQARLEAARALPAAYLREVFESEEAKEWQKAELGELVLTRLRTGLSKPGSPDSNKQCLTLSSVRNGELLLDKVKPTDISDEEAQRNQLKAGAFYVVRGNGNKSLVGRGGIAPQECNGVTFPDLLFEVNSDPTLLSALFLRWAWDSESVRSQIEEKSMTAAGIYKINQRNLASIELRLPSLPVQERIAADLYKRNSKVSDIQALTDQELAAINAVPASLLRQAFSGAL